MDTFWIAFFSSIVAFAAGFVLAAVMSAGKRADADMERLEQILRREP
jgi:hypothetical protein